MSTYGGGNQYQSFFNNSSGMPFQGQDFDADFFTNLFKNPNSMSAEDRARSMGYFANPDGSFISPGGIRMGNTMPDAGITRQRSAFEDTPQGMNQMGQALFFDLINLNNATNQNFQEGRQAIDDARQSVVDGSEAIRQSGAGARDYFDMLSGQAFDEGNRLFEESKERITAANEEYKKNLADRESSLISGATQASILNSSFQEAQAAAKAAGPNSPEAAALREFEVASNAQIAKQSSEIAMGVVNAMFAGDVQSEGLIGQAGGLKASYDRAGEQLGATGAQVFAAAENEAAKFGAQGMMNIANMTLANPYSPVGMAPTIAAMFKMFQTPGASEFDIPQDFFTGYAPSMGGSVIA